MIEGFITHEGRLSQTTRGIDICTFSISTVPANGQKNLEVTEYDVLAWGNIAKPCAEHCSKGKGIRISGRMKQEYWVNSEGKALSRIVLLAEEVEFIPSREKEIPEENT